jgi:molybdopterin molybdotransferase
MIQYHEALDLIRSCAHPGRVEKVDLAGAHKRILAEDACYDSSIPPFNRSAMDGYACRRADIGNELIILETIFAGSKPTHKIGVNECAKIMTGAVVPDGADCVFMVEDAELKAADRVICTRMYTECNISYEGEDAKKGEVAVGKYTLITSRHIPLLAGAGVVSPLVFCRPAVSIFATGSELVEPGIKPLPHQIRNSNAYQMIAQLSDMGISGDYLGIIRDDKALTEKRLAEAFSNSNLLLLTGGVSAGDSDFVPDVLEILGFEMILSKSAIQPGKPIIFARKGHQYCFGLSGNPVSSFVQFELYVRPFIYSLMGYHYQPPVKDATLVDPIYRTKADRLKFIPALLNQKNEALPLEFHGSAHIDSLSHANCLIEIPIGIYEINKGETVHVRPL